MINYKSFKLPGNAKLRVRADKIVATQSSKSSSVIDLYVEGVTLPWHIPFGEDENPCSIIDYIWERHSVEEESD